MATGIDWGRSAKRFSDHVKKTVKDVNKGINKALVIEVKEITRDTKRRTPIRTRTARRGWKRKRIKKQRAYRISNRVSYIRFLEEGTKGIKPRRMLETSVRAGEIRLKKRIQQIFRKQKVKWL